MSYSVKVYKQTGFNATNVPDSPATLETAAVSISSWPAIDILQDAFLRSIKVRTNWASIETADYCKVGDWYYAIDGIKMLALDVAELTLIPDFILSAGGVSGLQILDGITERVHVAKSSDTFGAYAEDDPLTAPSEPMDIDIENISLGTATSTVIESAIDLIATATAQDGLTYTDSVSGETVTVPNFSSLSQYTTHQYGGTHKTASYIVPTPTPGTPELLQVGIDRARSLGVENAIIAQYNVPSAFFVAQTAGFKQNLTSSDLDNPSTIAFVPNANAKNMRINYGSYTKYGLLSAGGNRCEFNAEDIYVSGATAPTIHTKADVRKDGCPYHRFKTYRGDNSDAGFWRNCVAGAQWEQVPMVYTAKSGGALERMEYDAEREYQRKTIEHQLKGGAVASMTAQTFGGLNKGGAGGAFVGVLSGVATSIAGAREAIDHYIESEELANLKFAASQVIAPNIQFPYNTDIMRDALGNGVLVYRYKYSNADVARVDKLLTMYGYRITKPLEQSDFTNRSKFNFVRASGVTLRAVGGTVLPKWWLDGCAAQLAGGIRIWHTTPSESTYTDGSNV